MKKSGPNHGGSKNQSFKVWCTMRQRCLNPNNPKWPHYGGRGVTICERWTNYVNFVADMGEPLSGLTLERLDVNGHYEPGNCEWADKKTQRRNRTDSKHITLCGRTMIYREACEEVGISYGTLGQYSRTARLPYAEMFYTLLERKLYGTMVFPGYAAEIESRRRGYPQGKHPRTKWAKAPMPVAPLAATAVPPPTTTTVTATPPSVTTTTGNVP